MSEQAPARDLSKLLMEVLDGNMQYLRGAISAADAISDLLIDEAEDNGAVYNTNRGLRWALQEASDTLRETVADLREAHRLAQKAAGGVTPEERLAELAAGAKEASAGREPEPAGEARP